MFSSMLIDDFFYKSHIPVFKVDLLPTFDNCLVVHLGVFFMGKKHFLSVLLPVLLSRMG